MKVIINEHNPFRETFKLGHAFVWETVSNISKQNGKVRVLDYGAFDGALINELSRSGLVYDSYSLDLNFEVVNQNSSLVESDNTLIHISKGNPLPFESGSFDLVLLMGVLEHVYDQRTLLTELNRVLKHDGNIIVAVPGKHLFSFLDFGNWKFVFPKLHKIYIVSRYGKDYYHEHFVKCSNGLIGDIEVEKRWHEHFTHSELSVLLKSCGFFVEYEDGYGFFYRIIHNIRYFIPFLSFFLDYLLKKDALLFSKAEIFVRAKKK
jgi:SAM-dependent methyltransferase